MSKKHFILISVLLLPLLPVAFVRAYDTYHDYSRIPAGPNISTPVTISLVGDHPNSYIPTHAMLCPVGSLGFTCSPSFRYDTDTGGIISWTFDDHLMPDNYSGILVCATGGVQYADYGTGDRCSGSFIFVPDIFTLNGGPITINRIIEEVKSFNLQPGIERSLLSKLDAAKSAIQRNQKKTAINILKAFINEVKAQKSKAISSNQVNTLTSATQALINSLGGHLLAAIFKWVLFGWLDKLVNAMLASKL